MELRLLIRKVNFAVPVAGFLFGKKHHAGHRMFLGLVVMFVGVGIAKSCGHSASIAVAVVGDMIGYAVHGLGLAPFLEKLLEIAEES